MMRIKDEVEKMATSADERELEEEETEQEEEEVTDAGDGEDESDAEDECRSNEDKEKNKEALPQASDKIETNIQLPVQPREKKKSDELNLNNEVVRMRKEVKRVRALIIRKLTRQISSLKKKKGKETEIERNQRRASRLLEEIHAMKTLSPDLVGFVTASFECFSSTLLLSVLSRQSGIDLKMLFQNGVTSGKIV